MTIKTLIRLLMVLTLLAGNAQAREMKVLTEELPPYNFTKAGKITGSSTEVVREILRRLDHPQNIQVASWARSYKRLQNEPYVALFTTTRTPEREDQFHWVGPLLEAYLGFYARKDRGLQLNSLEDAKQVGSIATYKDDAREQLLISMGFDNLDSSKSPASNLKKLMTGRVDLWLYDNVGMRNLARQLNIDPAELEMVLPFTSFQSYVAISKTTPQEVVDRWQAAFMSMVEDGTFFDISRRWLPYESIPDFNLTGQYAAALPALKIYTEDSPPGSYVQAGRPAGFSVDLVREILRRLKQPDTITVVPWSRGYTLAMSTPGVALFATTRLAQREKQFRWVGPLYSHTWAFYGRKGSGLQIGSLEEARGVERIGTYRKDAKEQYLQAQGFKNLVSANRNISNIRHLSEGELDLWVSSDFNMAYLVDQAGFEPAQFERVYAFHKVSNYIAFSRGTPLAVIRDWQRCFEGMKQDGTYMRIARQHDVNVQR
ncbi:MAG: transporter substrate-binding domain-containing protein [Desulfobacterales bacterium]|nr:transporter substrate-binding domain-containing protein [Desulfobacterales bacterium]